MPRPASEYIPQLTSDTRPTVMWSMVAALSVLLVMLIVGAPVARANGYSGLAFVIYGAFGKLCHQIPERSFFIAGHQFAVCARCMGLYAGFTISTLAYPFIRSLRQTDTPGRRWLFLAAVPTAVDFSLGYFGIWENTHLSRFLTGSLLGSVAVFYVVPGMIQLNLTDLRQVFTRNAAATQ